MGVKRRPFQADGNTYEQLRHLEKKLDDVKNIDQLSGTVTLVQVAAKLNDIIRGLQAIRLSEMPVRKEPS